MCHGLRSSRWIIAAGFCVSADGCTKRANSVNAIIPTNGNLTELVAYCESFYQTRRQPAIFRLLSFVDDLKLDSYLADAGYAFIDPSLVLYQALDDTIETAQAPINTDRASWLKVYNEISGADPTKQETQAKILDRVSCNFPVHHLGACGPTRGMRLGRYSRVPFWHLRHCDPCAGSSKRPWLAIG